MPNYFYTAKSGDGETKTGNIFARDDRDLAQLLKNQDLFLIKAVSAEERRKINFNFDFLSFSGKVSSTEKVMVSKSLWIMSASGLPVVKSFDILAKQAQNKKLKSALSNIKESVGKGESIASSLAKYPDIFSDFFVNMVKAGEESGTLSEIFETLAGHIEKDHELRSKIKGALIYPAIILCAIAGVVFVVSTFFLPNLISLFTAMNVDIPIYTRAILVMASFSSKNWYFIILFVAAFGIALRFALKTKQGKQIKDAILLKIPVISAIVQKNNCTFFTSSMGSLMASGVSLAKSLEITSGIVNNFYFQKALNESAEKVRKGHDLSESLSHYKNIFPYGVIEMLQVGEETGQTSSILKKLADFYRKEAMASLENISTLIEPVLMIVLGILVGIFAVAVLEPMYSIIKAVE